MKKSTPPKLTKRQRKALRGPNHMVEQVLKSEAETREIDGVAYKGEPPRFVPILDPVTKMETGYRKIRPSGIPFVRVEQKARYIA